MKIISWIERMATNRIVLILFVALLVMMLGVMPYCARILENISPGITIIDLLPPLYSSQDMIDVLEQLGKEGRHAYQRIELIADSLYPIVYSLFYATLIAWLLQKNQWNRQWTKRLILVPILGGLFDFFENFGIIYAIHTFPQVSGWGLMTPIFSLVKWVGAIAGLMIIIVLLLNRGLKVLR